MKIVFSTFFLLALTSIVSSENLPFTTCGSGSATVSSIDVSPYPVKGGQDLTVKVVGDMTKAVSAGEFKVTAKFLGIPVYTTSGDLCTLGDEFKCPHDAGDLNIVYSQKLPSIPVSGKISLEISANDQDGNSLLCIDSTVKVGKNQSIKDDLDALVHEPEFIDHINTSQRNWVAGHNHKFTDATLRDVQKLCGAKQDDEAPILPVREIEILDDLPEEFDSLTNWPDCTIIGDIRDQATCGSCYAVSSASTFTDRYCIETGKNVYLSASDPLSCCGFFEGCGMGCNGGYPSGVWRYFENKGAVTGAHYGAKTGCFSYPLAPCSHHVNGKYPPCDGDSKTPSCPNTCEDSETWDDSKHHASTSYSVSSDENQIMSEIVKNGPVTAAFTVYADFPTYKSGVYHHTSGSELGGHAVEIVGFGVEDGTKYWKVKNSWNADWGDKGYFKILRGEDECGIESSIVTGLVKSD